MKKILALIICAMMVFTLFACNAPVNTNDAGNDATGDIAAVKAAGKLVVGMTDYAPMNYKDENGAWTGFDTEFAQAYAAKLGVDVEFIIIDWDNKYTELEAKSIDCIWNGMTITEEGKLNASISDPYVKNAQVVVMANDKLADYADTASMTELSFAVENGSAGADAAEAAGFTNVTAVQDQAAALLEVASGSVDACIIDITMANAMTGEGTSYADYGYTVELSAEEYGVAFRKGSDLTADFNAFMAEAMTDGTLDNLADKYELTLVK
ncbi:MAG: transporter substrate-binding domain-containing protein [Clostridia bacterium]|nr:transporter substrate-binding domain-containing protein [Clostridia bacterium]